MGNTNTIAGTGLIALDAVRSQEDPHKNDYKLFAAGSCPNVFAILASRGWQAMPAGMLGRDRAAHYVRLDFERWGVDASLIASSENYSTPVYIQTIDSSGHRFSNHCPFCGEWIPTFQPLQPDDQSLLEARLPNQADGFYLERVTGYGLRWLKHYNNQGALCYFEPNRIDHEACFEQIIQHAHIIKYSHERRFHIHEITNRLRPPLEIETLGKDGIQFRINHSNMVGDWVHIPAMPAEPFRDACGAGDWFSAHVIDTVATRDEFYAALATPEKLADMFAEAQQWSAKNCAYEGARGLLYNGNEIQRGTDFCPHCGGGETLLDNF